MKRERHFETENPKYAFIPLVTKKIVKGWAKISFDHHERVSMHDWYLGNDGYVYPKSAIDGKWPNLHNFVVKYVMQQNLQDKYIIDHINRDKLDNTVENLRLVNKQQNARNKTKISNCSSVYYNVTKRSENRFQVTMQFDGLTQLIGTYNSEIRAAEMRDVYLLQRFTDFDSSGFNLNFPDRKEELKHAEFKSDIKRVKQGMFIGVSREKNCSVHHPYAAKTKIGDKFYRIGKFKTEIEAAQAYDMFIMQRKLDRPLNFKYSDYVPDKKIQHSTVPCSEDDSKIGLVVGEDVIVIDKSDYDRVKHGKISRSKTSNGYVSFMIRFAKSKRIALARFICEVSDPKLFVDHLDSNTKNNSKSNLHVCVPAGNNEGRKKVKTASSQFYGVRKSDYGYRTVVIHQGKKYSAYFKKEEDAAIANDLYILLHLQNTKKRKNFTHWNAENVEAERVRLNSLLPNQQNKL